jgi:hypothetical protein
MIPNVETIGLINFQIGLLSLNLEHDPALYDEEKKHELRVRIEELQKTKMKLTMDQQSYAAGKVGG